MNRNDAMRIYDLLIGDFPEGETIESRIRSGVCRMMASMWRVYWQCCFEGVRKHIVRPPDDLSPDEAVRAMWLRFAGERREEWTTRREKLERFGRRDDAAKEALKTDQLDRLVTVWKRETGGES